MTYTVIAFAVCVAVLAFTVAATRRRPTPQPPTYVRSYRARHRGWTRSHHAGFHRTLPPGY